MIGQDFAVSMSAYGLTVVIATNFSDDDVFADAGTPKTLYKRFKRNSGTRFKLVFIGGDDQGVINFLSESLD